VRKGASGLESSMLLVISHSRQLYRYAKIIGAGGHDIQVRFWPLWHSNYDTLVVTASAKQTFVPKKILKISNWDARATITLRDS